MVEAIVGVALRAILASVLLGGLLAGLVLVATRTLALTAATRHALWITALVATAVMPLAGIGVSLARAAAAPAVATLEPSASSARPAPAMKAIGAIGPSTPARHRVSYAGTGAPPPNGSTVAAPHSLPNPLDLAGYTPRVSRALALIVVGIWIAGAVIGLIGLAASIVRVRGLKRRSSPLDGALAEELPWLTEVDRGREIYLRLSFEIETPVAIGFGRPVILIPTELASADGLVAIEQLVLHEHAHLRRYDDWTNLVQRTIERIFWFNPIVWLVGRRIALEREIASDDDVVAKTGEAHAYATSLWKLAREMRMPEHAVVAPGALLTRKQITIRIEQLLDKNRARLHRSPAAALGIGLAGVLAVAFVATSAPAVELPVSPLAEATGARATSTTSSHADATKLAAAKLDATKLAAAKAWPSPAQPGHVQAPQTISHAHVLLRAPADAPPHAHQLQMHTAVVEQRIVRVAQATETTAPVLPPAPLPSAAAVPAAPSVPAVPPVPSSAPQTRRAVGEARRVGTEVTRVLQEVMASLPGQIAQETSSSHQHASLDGVKLSRELIASCVGCSFRNADARGLDLHGLRISAGDFSGADMRGVNLSSAQLLGASLAGANLSNADLRNAHLTGVDLRGAVFDGAQLDGIKLVGVSIRHVSLRGTMLRSVIANCTGCDFARLDLHGQDLHGITLSGADLSFADLRNANLSGVRFLGVDFSHANLAGADLTNAHFDGCDLSSADLRGARTAGMTMQGSDLGG